MEQLNHHHLYYFWVIAREGGVTKAAAKLRLTHSTLSTQLRSLEEFLGAELFERRGRRLVLTPLGAEVAAQASELFRLGEEIVDLARGRRQLAGRAFRVGVVSAMPKSIAARLLAPGADASAGPIVVRQGRIERLLDELASGQQHLVLADAPPPAGSAVKVHAHLLGETEILLYAARPLARKLGRRFPSSLDGAPMLFPGEGSPLRRSLERWLAERDLRVDVRGEIDDAGMLRALGGAGRGAFPVRAALRTEVEEAHGAVLVGELEGLRERYYAISIERRVRHPGVAAVIEAGRRALR